MVNKDDDNSGDRTLAVRELKKLFPQLQDREINKFNLVIFDRVPLGLDLLDSARVILEANSSLVTMLGYSDRQEIKNQTMSDYYLEPDLYLQWQQQLNHLEAIAEYEDKLYRVDGEIICYEGAVTKITASKRAELERIELLKLSQFTSSVLYIYLKLSALIRADSLLELLVNS